MTTNQVILSPTKQAAKRTAIQNLKYRFDYSLNLERLRAVSFCLCTPEIAGAALCYHLFGGAVNVWNIIRFAHWM